jgi:hypothetical protein
MVRRRVELGRGEVLVYKGMEIDQQVLDAVVETNKRLLWAFVRGEGGDVRAVPYSEDHVIWLSESDITKEREVEI